MADNSKKWRLRIVFRRVNGDYLDLDHQDERAPKPIFANEEIELVVFAEKHFNKWQRATNLRWHKWSDSRYDSNYLNYTYPVYVIEKVWE